MTILEFIDRFSEEKACKSYYRQIREQEGITCKNCGGTNHYWLSTREIFECSHCKFRTSLRSGTVMENSRLPFKTWFLVMLFMTSTKKGVSACEMQRQVGHQRYATIWGIMHRLRKTMGQRDDLYILEGMIEFDEGCFSTVPEKKSKKPLKRGRGSKKQTNVAVMAESTPLEDIGTTGKSSQCRYFKLKALSSYTSKEVDEVIKASVEEDSVLFTDKSTSYLSLAKYVDLHISEKSTKETTNDMLKWVHIAISNAKRNLLGIYHSVKATHLQSYLDEFCYKLNRRGLKSIFERLIVASVNIPLQTTV
jgi:transposase-like protein